MISSHSLLGTIFVLCPLPDCKFHENRDWDREPQESQESQEPPPLPPLPSTPCHCATSTQQTARAPPWLTGSSPARQQSSREGMSQNSLASSRRPAVLVEMSDGNHLWLEAATVHLQRHPPGEASACCPHRRASTWDDPGWSCLQSFRGWKRERATCQDTK